MSTKPSFWTSLHGVATLLLMIAALYFLFVEHAEHVLPYLPLLIILLCPLMHIFMHKRHGGHNHKEGDNHQEVTEAYRRGLEEGRKQTAKRPKHE